MNTVVIIIVFMEFESYYGDNYVKLWWMYEKEKDGCFE